MDHGPCSTCNRRFLREDDRYCPLCGSITQFGASAFEAETKIEELLDAQAAEEELFAKKVEQRRLKRAKQREERDKRLGEEVEVYSEVLVVCVGCHASHDPEDRKVIVDLCSECDQLFCLSCATQRVGADGTLSLICNDKCFAANKDKYKELEGNISPRFPLSSVKIEDVVPQSKEHPVLVPINEVNDDSDSAEDPPLEQTVSPRKKLLGGSSKSFLAMLSPRKKWKKSKSFRSRGARVDDSNQSMTRGSLGVRIVGTVSWEKRFVVLTGGELCIYASEKMALSKAKTQQKIKTLQVEECILNSSLVSATQQYVFSLKPKNGAEVMFSAHSDDQMEIWNSALRDCSLDMSFPGISTKMVGLEPEDVTWKSMIQLKGKWTVEESFTPVDISFSELVFEPPKKAETTKSVWVGAGFVGVIERGDTYTRLIWRNSEKDTTYEYHKSKMDLKSDLKILRKLKPDLQSTDVCHVTNPTALVELSELDALGEQDMSHVGTFKFGVIRYTKGMETEDQLWANDEASPDFENFLDCLGDRVDLPGWSKYAGGLDVGVPGGGCGQQSVYTIHKGLEIMFHVNTMFPAGKSMQRKRHIGNDYCIIVFLDDANLVYPSDLIRSQYNHVFLIVALDRKFSEEAEAPHYRVCCCLREGMPVCQPKLVRPPVYGASSIKDFLLQKAVNGEKAAKYAPDYLRQRTTLREWFIKGYEQKWFK